MTSSAAPQGRRAGAFVLALLLAACAVPTARASGEVLTPELAVALRACLRKVNVGRTADVLGMSRVPLARDCPALAAQLGSRPLPGMRSRRLDDDGSMSLRQLGDLVRLVESAAEPRAFTGQLSSRRLALIIDALDPAARGELSTRARLARWWRSVVGEFDPLRRTQRDRSQRIAWPLGLWSTVSWVAASTAALLVLTVLVQEVRAALAVRYGGRRTSVRTVRRREPTPDLDAIDALPPRERAGALLGAVAARLHSRGALAPPDPLTPREVGEGARLPDAERDGLRLIAEVGETGAYGRHEPSPQSLVAARAVALRWLASGDALARLRAWRRAGPAVADGGGGGP